MGDVSNSAILTAADLQKIFMQAKASTTDPVSLVMKLFEGLGENATIFGDVLRQALSDSSAQIGEPFHSILAGVQAVTKSGNSITITSDQDVETVVAETKVKLEQTISLNADLVEGCPTIDNIVGVSVHKFFWIEIQSVQLRQSNGRKSVRVATAMGSKDFDLP